jgi:putative transferase (TIGR04331 family)
MVSNGLPRFSYSMYSGCVAGQWLDYFEDQCVFVGHLPQRIRDVLTVRLHREDYDWAQFCRWRERFPDLQLDTGNSRIDDLIRQTRLYIATYNATTFLESLSMDVPTIIYWNPNHWELRDPAIADFEELAGVGIFHSTPQSAARHAAAVWDDVDAWWSDSAVVDARRRFMQRYCHLPDDLLDRITRALHEAAPVTEKMITR